MDDTFIAGLVTLAPPALMVWGVIVTVRAYVRALRLLHAAGQAAVAWCVPAVRSFDGITVARNGHCQIRINGVIDTAPDAWEALVIVCGGVLHARGIWTFFRHADSSAQATGLLRHLCASRDLDGVLASRPWRHDHERMHLRMVDSVYENFVIRAHNDEVSVPVREMVLLHALHRADEILEANYEPLLRLVAEMEMRRVIDAEDMERIFGTRAAAMRRVEVHLRRPRRKPVQFP